MPTLYLIDGSAYLYRAYHALPPLQTRDGVMTHVLYGTLAMLRNLLNQRKPDYIAVVFDAPGGNFRHRHYPDYKANRPAMPDDLKQQIEPLHQAIKGLGLPLLQVADVEADDVIATLARQAQRHDWSVRIYSGDKDLTQLVSPQISMIDPMRKQWLDEQGVKDKYGVCPHQMVDYLALLGDSADHIPGVPGVGKKTAVKLLQQFGSLENILQNTHQIKGKLGQKIADHQDQARLAHSLITLQDQVVLPLSLDQCQRQAPDHEGLQTLYQRYEFTLWQRELATESVKPPTKTPLNPTIACHYTAITNQEQLQQWLAQCHQAEYLAVDVETTGLNFMAVDLVGVSLAIKPYEGVYIPLGHPDADQLSIDTVIHALQPILENPAIGKVGQHSKFDQHILKRYGIHLQGLVGDSMLASYLLNPTITRHDMDSLARYYLNRETTAYESLVGKGKQQKTLDQLPMNAVVDYAAEDAEVTHQLVTTLHQKLKPLTSQWQIYQQLELPLVAILQRMESRGILLDCDLLSQQGQRLKGELAKLTTQAYALAGCEFNVNSPKQLQALLFEDLGLPILRKTPKGQPSTAEEVLQQLAADYPLPAVILKHRSLSKLISTYIDKLPTMVNPVTKRLHTSYHQAATSTGRLASSEPNLQNIPIRTPEGQLIRQAFIAAEGYQLVAVDYSQIELRIMAHLSEDQGLISAFQRNEDIHQRTASEIFGQPPTQITPEQRRAAKAVNFGLIYGMSPFGLARQLGTDQAQARDLMIRYFETYPGVQAYMNSIRQRAKAQGYVETLFGRRLYLPDLQAKNANLRQAAERLAINAPMQGTAADLIKAAMIQVDQWLTKHNQGIHLLLQVHDELVFEVPEAQVATFCDVIPELMIQPAPLTVPLQVAVGCGENWCLAH